MNRFLSFLRHPYTLVLIGVLVLADIGGVVHAFRAHGRRDGVIALVLPPYGLYRAVESLSHRTSLTDADIVQLSRSPSGRQTLTESLQLRTEVWTTLLALISGMKNHQLQTTMHESGLQYNITATVPSATGPVSLTIDSEGNKDLSITILDDNRDEQPDMLQITKIVNGKPEVHNTPIAKYNADDASQFNLAWSLSWSAIAEQEKAAIQRTSH